MLTLVDALRESAQDAEKGITFVRTDGSEHHHSYADIWREARRRAAFLAEQGIRKGDRAVLALSEPDDFVLTFFGVITAGAVPVPLYPPMTLARLDVYLASLRRFIDVSGAGLLITAPRNLPMLGDLGARAITTDAIAQATEIPDDVATHVTPEDLGLLQFTSGSTSQPKGVMVTHANLTANSMAIMFDGLRSDPSVDKGVSWLPLYHDMGLIGFVIAPIFAHIPVVLLPTTTFVRRPSIWLDAIHRHRGTISFAPNFAFALATQGIAERQFAGWDLSCLRALGCGAEPIRAATLRGFVEKFAVVGLRADALLPSYGMAEATLAISFGGLDSPLRTDRCDPLAFREGRAEPAGPIDASSSANMEIVSCGRPFPGHVVEIVDAEDRPLKERQIGEIVVSGASIAKGYFGDVEATRNTFRSGRLFTGDLGYFADGELYICGRSKDVIILRGRNYFPQDIEKVISEVEGVRHSQVAVFTCSANMQVSAAPPPADKGTNQEPRLVVVAEVRKLGDDDAAILRRNITLAVSEQLGLKIDDVYLIRRGTLPRTSSGKVRRKETRTRLENGTLETSTASEGDRGLQ